MGATRRFRLLCSAVLLAAFGATAAAQGGPNKPPKATVDITSPADRTVLTQATVDVAVSFASPDKGGETLTGLELRVNGAAVATFQFPDGPHSGTHTFAAVDLSAFANTGQFVPLVARGLQGHPQKKFVDSPAVNVKVTLPDTTPPTILVTAPLDGSITNSAAPAISADVADTGGSGLDPTKITLVLNAILVPATVTPGVDTNHATLSFTPASPLGDGVQSFTVDAFDLAGNEATPVTASFFIDTHAPGVVFTSPADGSSASTASPVSFSALLTDPVGGVALGSLLVRVNGVDITGAVTIGPSGSSAYGPPSSVTVAGAFTPVLGPNLVLIQAADSAGNLGSNTLTVNGTDSTPGFSGLVLTMVSGDGQTITAGECSQPLAVQVTFADTGLPVPNATILFAVPAPGDWMSSVGAIGPVTDDAGNASMVLIPMSGGSKTVLVSVLEDDSASPVQFTITARTPSLADVSVPGPCNTQYGNQEFPGSALPKLMKIMVKDADGNGAGGKTVVPSISDFEGQRPPPGKVGEFFPKSCITRPDGTATFAFVIDPDIKPDNSKPEPGAFTMQFVLAGVRKSDGTAITVDVPGTVKDPATRSVPDVQIDYTDRDQSGQGQVGVSGLQCHTTLKVKCKSTAAGLKILEGDGSFQSGDVGTPQFWPGGCGSLAVVVFPDFGDPDGKANIKFTPASEGPILVAVSPASDIFVIAPPEVRVTGGGPMVRDYLKATDFRNPNPDTFFHIQVVAPVGLSEAPKVDVQARQACDVDVPTFDNDIAPTSLQSLAMGQTSVTGQYAIYETTQTLMAFDGRLGFEDVTPTAGAGQAFLQITNQSLLQILANVGPQKVERKVRVLALNAAGQANTRPKFVYPDTNGTLDMQATVTAVDAAPKVTKLTYDFGDGTTVDVDTKFGEPKKHTYNVPVAQANRRKSFTLKVTITDDKGGTDTISRVIRVSMPDTAEQKPAPMPSTVIQDFQAVVNNYNWNTGEALPNQAPVVFRSPPYNLNDDPFTDPPSLIEGLLIQNDFVRINQGGVQIANYHPEVGNRLVFDDAIKKQPGVKTFELTLFDFRESSYFAYGSYLTKNAWTYEVQELNSFVRHHQRHVLDIFNCRTNAGTTPGALFRGLYHYYKVRAGITAYDTLPDNPPANQAAAARDHYILLESAFDNRIPPKNVANPGDYTRVPHAFIELEPFTEQVTDTTATAISHRLLSDAVPQAVTWFNECILPIRADVVNNKPNIQLITDEMKKHIKTQYNALVGAFPELRDAKEYGHEFVLPELKFTK